MAAHRRSAPRKGAGAGNQGGIVNPLRVLAAAAALLCAIAPPAALAQSWPSKPVRIIVPHAPGGVTDVVTRTVAQPLSEALGQPVVVDNRPGAAGLLGTEIAATAAPDGYTLLMFVDTNTIFPSTVKSLRHDPAKSFAPITILGRGSHVLVAHPSLPVDNLQDLVRYAKAIRVNCRTPRRAPAARSTSASRSSSLPRASTWSTSRTKAAARPSSTWSAARSSLAYSDGAALPHIKSGGWRCLTGATRSKCCRRAHRRRVGFPGFETGQWQGIVAPAGTPAAIITRTHDELLKIMRQPAIAEKLASIGMDTTTSATPEDFARMLQDEPKRWPDVVKAAGIQADDMARPLNIVFITSDQQRGDCFGFEGRNVKTPHLDEMARFGTRFNACITPNLVCQPSRSSILTGLLPLTHGVSDNGIDLPAAVGEHGFAGTLVRAGYDTALIGKAHFTTSHTFSPTGTPECRASSANYPADWDGPYMGFYVEMMLEGHNHFPPMHRRGHALRALVSRRRARTSARRLRKRCPRSPTPRRRGIRRCRCLAQLHLDRQPHGRLPARAPRPELLRVGVVPRSASPLRRAGALVPAAPSRRRRPARTPDARPRPAAVVASRGARRRPADEQ
jgi:tripartite-type tricarboxylate transporter receptor subunit TctC